MLTHEPLQHPGQTGASSPLSLYGLLAAHVATRRDLQRARHRLIDAAAQRLEQECVEATRDIERFEAELLAIEEDLTWQLGSAFRPVMLAR